MSPPIDVRGKFVAKSGSRWHVLLFFAFMAQNRTFLGRKAKRNTFFRPLLFRFVDERV